MLSQFTLPGVLFALTLVSGFWLSQTGTPYSGPLFNLHKLIALGGVGLAGIQFYKTLHTPDWLLIALLVGSALCVIALFASGALMSAGKLDYTLMLTIHRVAPVFLVVGLGYAVLLIKATP